MNIKYSNSLLVEDYNNLRESVGWHRVEGKQALAGIQNSAYVISAIHENKTVGMARVIGDGGYIVVIVDVIVLPEYQGKGIGKSMMQKVMDYIKSSLHEGQWVFVNLMSAKEREPFYSQFGFETRPNEKAGAGMTQYIGYRND